MSAGSRLERILRRAVQDLRAAGGRFAVLGGIAVSARSEPRFTRDIDLAVSVRGDPEAEALVASLRGRGYEVFSLLEHEAAGRLATVRLIPPGEGREGILLDLLFASSGVEPEIVRAAEPLDLPGRLKVKVASRGHLIATKVLSRDDARRPQDRLDLIALLRSSGAADLREARMLLLLIEERGFHRGKDLRAELEDLLGETGRPVHRRVPRHQGNRKARTGGRSGRRSTRANGIRRSG